MKHQLLPLLALLLILAGLGWYVDSLAHQEITDGVKIVIYALVAAAVLVVVGLLLFALLIFRERLLKERASRKVAEREANVMVLIAEEGQQVYIRDTDKAITWRTAHLDGRVSVNGQFTPPSQTELITWQTYMLRHRPSVIGEVAPQLLPASTQNDLLAVLDSVQRCLIVGASDSGILPCCNGWSVAGYKAPK